MNMKELWGKNWKWPILAALCGGISAAALQAADRVTILGAFNLLSQQLRRLSLSGSGGNLIAWSIVLAVSLLPALGLFWRGRQKEDWLLLLTGIELFVGLYFLVNPTLLFPVEFSGTDVPAQGWGIVAVGCVLSTLAAWIILRLLSVLKHSPALLLPKTLFFAAVFYGFFIGFKTVSDVFSSIRDISSSNTDSARVITSASVAAVLAAVETIPPLMGTQVLLWGERLANGIDQAPFAEETVKLAETTARGCSKVARISLITTVCCNLLRLLCLPFTASVRIFVYLPVETLALCAALLLLSRYFRRAKAVSDDNDSII